MKAATEEFLYLLLWTAEALAQPTWRNLDEAFESWAYRTGCGRQLRELERRKLVERSPQADVNRVYRLTEAGRRVALAGVDPPQRWSRPWDGLWRVILFDVPEIKNRERVRLRRTLRGMRFGYLQHSVWVSPDSLGTVRRLIGGSKSEVESLTLFEGWPCGGESDLELVSGAWDFEAINRCYLAWHRVADAVPQTRAVLFDRPKLRAWAARERVAWRAIVKRDPFLPEPLLPASYPGRQAWERRVRLLNSLGRILT